MLKATALLKPDDLVIMQGSNVDFTVDCVDSGYALLKYTQNGLIKLTDWHHISELTKVEVH